MTDEELDGLGSALDDFLQPYLFCCGYTQTFAHLHTYCRGLLSDLKRKSVEPIALASGCAVRTLQEFLRDHHWEHSQVRDQLQRHVAATLAGVPDDGLGNIGLIDETSALKSGTKTPGVQRQYLGCVGKIDNGIVTVHLGVCKGRYKTLDRRRTVPAGGLGERPRPLSGSGHPRGHGASAQVADRPGGDGPGQGQPGATGLADLRRGVWQGPGVRLRPGRAATAVRGRGAQEPVVPGGQRFRTAEARRHGEGAACRGGGAAEPGLPEAAVGQGEAVAADAWGRRSGR